MFYNFPVVFFVRKPSQRIKLSVSLDQIFKEKNAAVVWAQRDI
jgi:hypothetical protein